MSDDVNLQWLERARRLQAIASTGLHFGEADYDKERYAEVGEIAASMLSDLASVPVERIAQLMPDYGEGYATPKIDVRGAVFRGDDILLVQERMDELWTLPGGYADVGLSAGANTEKEILEEANLNVRSRMLFAVRHKSRHPYKPDIRDFYKFFFICEQMDDADPEPGHETMAAQFFSRNELPPLSEGRVIVEDIDLAFAYRDDPGRPTFFD